MREEQGCIPKHIYKDGAQNKYIWFITRLNEIYNGYIYINTSKTKWDDIIPQLI